MVLIVVIHTRRYGIGEFVPSGRELTDDGIVTIAIDFHPAHEREWAAYHVDAGREIDRDLILTRISECPLESLGVVGHTIAHSAIIGHLHKATVQACMSSRAVVFQ